jgi:hypothetical protein
MMKTTIVLAAILLASTSAHAYQVYQGCAVPSATPGATAKTWYVDPVSGKSPADWVTYFKATPTDTGIQGDSAHPWNSLTGITGGQWGQPTFRLAGYTRPLLANMDYFHRVATGNTDIPDNLGNPPVHPGDTILLKSGNYGDLGIGVGGVGTHYDNSDFLTIKAAPGQTPVFTTISVANVSKYIFDGLKVQSLNTTGAINGDWLVSVTDGGVTEPTHDIIFANMDISSADAIGTTQATMKNTWRNGYREAASAPAFVPTGAVTPNRFLVKYGGVELGMQFQSSVAGTITGLNFYKGPRNTGTHVGNLWDSTGTHNLGTVTFTNETASGWQTASFATPIANAANTNYIISYHSTTDFSQTVNFFPATATKRLTVGPLTAAVANGVYQYGPAGFSNTGAATYQPTIFNAASNYFVDPIFQAATGVTQTFWNEAVTPAVISSLALVHQPNTLGFPYTTCVSLENSHIHDTLVGFIVAGNNSLATANEVDHFGDDGTDYAGSNIALTKNNIHDNFSVNDGNHPDAMQGIIGGSEPPGSYNAFSNILLDSNRIIRNTDPTIPFPLGLQGIDAFDSDWTNVTVTNNVIVTSACWGMDLASIHNGLVANNTVLDDGSPIGHSGCTLSLTVGASTHQGPNSSNTRVTNNFASQIWVFNGFTPSMPPPDHNVAVGPQTSNHGVLYWGGAGNATRINLFNSSDANGNVAVNTGPAGQVVSFNAAKGVYDLHLLPTSVAIGAGSSVAGVGAPLPANDITGTPRVSAPPASAYRKAR